MSVRELLCRPLILDPEIVATGMVPGLKILYVTEL
jgi:hypothetical protein